MTITVTRKHLLECIAKAEAEVKAKFEANEKERSILRNQNIDRTVRNAESILKQAKSKGFIPSYKLRDAIVAGIEVEPHATPYDARIFKNARSLVDASCDDKIKLTDKDPLFKYL